MADFTIYIGNKNYSSWSLRAWLMLKASGAAFDEVLIPLYEPASRAAILRHSPSGKVPALRHGTDHGLGVAGDRRISGRAPAGGRAVAGGCRAPAPWPAR